MVAPSQPSIQALQTPFALGLAVVGDSLDDLIENYNFGAGRVWALVPLWMLVGPESVRRMTTDR